MSTVITEPLNALREAAILHASIPTPQPDAELPADVVAEHDKLRKQALVAAAHVMKRRPTPEDIAGLKNPAWIADLTDDQKASLAAIMQHHAPINVVVNGFYRLWALPAARIVPALN